MTGTHIHETLTTSQVLFQAASMLAHDPISSRNRSSSFPLYILVENDLVVSPLIGGEFLETRDCA